MNRRSVVWCQKPDPDDDDAPEEVHIDFRIAADWVATDADQLLLPIVVLERDGQTPPDPYPAILKQYGGERLLNDMLMADQEVEEGTTWRLLRWNDELSIEPIEI